MESVILDREAGANITPVPAIRPDNGRAFGAIILLWVMIGVSGIMIISYLAQFMMWWGTFDERIELSLVRNNFIFQLLLEWFYAIVFITSSVFFIRWFRRAYYNIHIIDSSYPSFSDGWAAGAWFVPILWWFRPYTIMREICEQTSEQAGKIDSKYEDNSRLINLAGWWWGLWVIAPILLRFAAYMSRNTAVIKLLLLGTGLVILSYIIYIISALIAINIIKKVSAAQLELYEDARMKMHQAEGVIDQTLNIGVKKEFAKEVTEY